MMETSSDRDSRKRSHKDSSSESGINQIDTTNHSNRITNKRRTYVPITSAELHPRLEFELTAPGSTYVASRSVADSTRLATPSSTGTGGNDDLFYQTQIPFLLTPEDRDRLIQFIADAAWDATRRALRTWFLDALHLNDPDC